MLASDASSLWGNPRRPESGLEGGGLEARQALEPRPLRGVDSPCVLEEAESFWAKELDCQKGHFDGRENQE